MSNKFSKNTNKIKYLVLIIIIGVLVFPNSASADILGIIDTLDAAMGGVEEITGPVTKYLVMLLLLYVISITSLYTSAHLLQFVTEDLQWISVYQNELVRSAWHFTSGIANMLIILILMAIALSFILKRETFEIKKTLPKLIMIALLINFSLVFVGALLDISNILYNTILSGNQGLPFQIIEKLGLGMYGILTSAMVWIIALAVSFVIPFTGPFAQLAVTTLVLGVGFLPNILTWLFQIFSAFLVSGMFFLYAFLFASRIFVIQLLAILSPLAFLCFILPQTEKHWDEWLQHLLQWVFFGIFLFFFLVVGLKLVPTVSTTPPPVLGIFFIADYFIYYFFLFVYLAIVMWLSKKTMPALADTLIQQGKAMGGIMWKGIKPLGGVLGKQAARVSIQKERLEKEGERRELTRMERAALWGGKLVNKPVRWAYRARGTTPEVEARKDIEKKAKEFEERYGEDVETASKTRLVDPESKIARALYLTKTKGAEGFKKLSKEQQLEAIRLTATSAPHKLGSIVRHAPELIDDEDVGGLVRKTLVSKGIDDKDVKTLIELGIASADDEADAIRKAAFKKVVDAMKVSDIENLSLTTLENEDFQEMVVRFKSIGFIKKIGEEKGSKYIETLRGTAEKLGPERIAMTNPTLLRQSVTNPGFRAIFPPLKITDPDTGEEREMEPEDMEWLEQKTRIRKEVEREEVEKRTEDPMRVPTPLPKIEKERGRIPKGLREDKKRGEKLISDITGRISKLSALDGGIKELKAQRDSLEELRKESEDMSSDERAELAKLTEGIDLHGLSEEIKRVLPERERVAEDMRGELRDMKDKLEEIRERIKGTTEISQKSKKLKKEIKEDEERIKKIYKGEK